MSDNGNGKRQRNDEEEADADSSDQRPTKSNKSSETASGNDSNTDAAVVAAEREETTSTAKSKEKAPSDETEETATTEEPAVVVVVVDRTGATEEETAEPAPKEPEEAAVPEPATAPIPTDTSGVPPLTTGPVPAPTPLDPTAPAALAAAAAPNDPEQVLEETGQVSALYIGRVIGKGGEMIRDLQARSGSRMDVEQKAEPGQPRIITYRGTRKTIDFAKQLVAMLCQEGVSEQQMPLGSAMREILIIPAKSVGKVIGRGGEMIRELQGRSQAKIQVDHSGASGIPPDQKQVTITGTDLAVTKAKEMVMFLVANPMMDAMQSIQMLSETKTQGGTWGSGGPYDTLPNQGVNMQPQSMPGGQGGYGGGYPGGGGGGGYQQPAPGGYGGGPPGGGYGGAPQGGFGGAPQQGGYQAQQSPGQYGGGGGGGGRPGPSGTDSDVTFVAKSYMGRIIGSKGVTINDLQRRSGADIQINQDVAPGQDCPITLRGNRQAIELAKQMIQEVIEVGPGHPYAGGADQGGGGGGGGYGGGGGGGYQQQGLDYGQQQQQQPGQFGGYGQQGFEQPQAAYGQSGMYGQQAPQQQYGGGGGYPQQQAQSAQQQQYPGYGQPGAPPPAPVASEWQSATSPDGQMYYFNARTGATQWDKPAGMP